jgi:hypothetical protein
MAVVGVVVQVTALMVMGLVTYHWKLQKGNKPVVPYAYPLVIIGTSSLVLGMFICAAVIEKSTKEVTWMKGPDAAHLNLHVLWLQRSGSVSDQSFESFAIMAKGPRDAILTSRRRGYEDSLVVPGDAYPSSIRKRKMKRHIHIANIVSNIFKAAAVTGAVISVVGFVLQFVGLRAMHWSASIAQLTATAIMTTIRAIERRNLLERPYGEELPDGHEMDWLTTAIARNRNKFWTYYSADKDDPSRPPSLNRYLKQVDSVESELPDKPWNWTLYTGDNARARWVSEPKDTVGNAQRMVKIRHRLGSLTKWTGPVSELAVSVASSVDEVMNTLFPGAGTQTFIWSLNVHHNDHKELVYLTVEKETTRAPWTANAAEIEALLSLWLFHVREIERSELHIRELEREKMRQKSGSGDEGDWLRLGQTSLQRQQIQFLGPDVPSLRRDLRWWIPGGIGTVLRAEDISGIDSDSESTGTGNDNAFTVMDYHHVTGFTKCSSSSDPENGNAYALRYRSQDISLDIFEEESELPSHGQSAGSLARISETRIETSLAQHVFTAFMWAVAQKVSTIDGVTNTRQTDTSNNPSAWQTVKLDNSILSRIAQGVRNTGLGSLEDAYLCIIPPLSLANKLPVAAAVDSVLRSVQKREAAGEWKEASVVYLELLRFSNQFGGATTSEGTPCPFSLKATAAVEEFCRTLGQLIIDFSDQLRDVKELEELKEDFEEKLEHVDESVLQALLILYNRQQRQSGLIGRWPELAPFKTASDASPRHLGYTPLHDQISGPYEITEENRRYLNQKDLFGWTPLHYAVLVDPPQDEFDYQRQAMSALFLHLLVG